MEGCVIASTNTDDFIMYKVLKQGMMIIKSLICRQNRTISYRIAKKKKKEEKTKKISFRSVNEACVFIFAMSFVISHNVWRHHVPLLSSACVQCL